MPYIFKHRRPPEPWRQFKHNALRPYLLPLYYTTLRSTNLRNADLSGAQLLDANLFDADLKGANLSGVSMRGANLERVDLRDADLRGLMDWKSMRSIKLANIHAVRNAPTGFVDWAKANGAVDLRDDEEWDKQLKAADSGA